MQTIRFLPLVIFLSLILSGCSVLNGVGIGGEPRLVCQYRDGVAMIDDRIAGSDGMRLSFVRRFTDGDFACTTG